MKKRLLSLLLALALLLSVLPQLTLPIRAEDEPDPLIGADEQVLEETVYFGTRIDTMRMLYHMAGEPAVDDLSCLDPFTDLDPEIYSEDALRAVAWAVSNNIAAGNSPTLFAPESAVTKAQVITILWRSLGSEFPEATECPYSDVTQSKYYYYAVLWSLSQTDWLDTEAEGTQFGPASKVYYYRLFRCEKSDGSRCWKLRIGSHDLYGCGDSLRWSFDAASGTLSITGSGAMWEYALPDNPAPWYRYRNDISMVSLPETATAIGSWAFADCSALTSVTLPEKLNSIGSNAFKGCTELTVIVVKNFECTISAESNTLGVPGTTTIYGYANSTAQVYAEQYGYSFISLGGLELSGECGADGDNLLWTLNTESGVLNITGAGEMKSFDTSTNQAPWYPYRSAVKELVFPEGLTSIGSSAFYRCTGLSSVTFPEGLTGIGSRAFQGCTGLSSITLPEGLTSISYSAFQDCTGLTSVTFPEGLTSISGSAFQGCTGLSSITFPERLNNIGYAAFRGCTGLTELVVKSFGCKIYAGNNTLGVPGTTTIYGYVNSTAQAYAEQYGYSFVSLGGLELSGECGADGDNLLWTLNTESGVLNITGAGKMKSYDSYQTPWYPYRMSISEIVFPDGLTNIGGSAFYDCTRLTSFTLPEGLTSIDRFAFYGCTGLSSVTLPEGLTGIGDNAFSGCTGLSSIAIPENITSIKNETFYGCTGLTSVTFPEGLTSIGGAAFQGCTGLSSITFPEQLNYVGYGAFSGCTGLTELVVKRFGCTIYAGNNTLGVPGTTTIYGYAGSTAQAYAAKYGYSFVSLGALELSGECGAEGDNLLWTLNTESGVLTITGVGKMKDYFSSIETPWYSYRSAVKELVFPEGLASIGSYAFYGCTGLTSVTFPEGLTSIGRYAFYGCSGLTSVTLPEGLTSIGGGAFYGCTGLTSVTLPEGLTSIGDSAFSGCTGLTSVTLPEGLAGIGDSAFSGCTGLTSVTLPEGLASIGRNAFNGCTGLCDLVVKSFNCSIYEDSTTLGVPGTTTIYGYTKSSAQAYAAQYSYSFVSLGSFVLSGECGAEGDNLIWTLNTETGLLTLTGSGAMADYSSYYSVPWASYRALITEVEFPEGLTGIGSYAFYGCTGLTSVTFPEGLTSIGYCAFDRCTGLTSVMFPEGLTSIGDSAFCGCTGLTSVTLPEGLASIGNSAFRGCTGLTSVTLPEGLASIGSSAFYGCTGLTMVVLKCFNCSISIANPNTLGAPEITTIYGYSYSTAETYAKRYGYSFVSLGIPEELTGECGAEGDNLIWTLNTANGLLTITGSGAMADYGSNYVPWTNYRNMISAVEFPEELTSIGGNAFRGCTGLSSVTFPEGLTSIGNSAFYGCTGLTSVTLPEGLASIGNSAFYGCTGLTSVTLPEGLASIGNDAFEYCTGLTSVTLPEGLTSIGGGAFSSCTGLTSVTLPEGLTSIGNSAFYGCTGLTSVTLPEGLTSIGGSAFSGCSGLTSVTLPEGLTSIGGGAFSRCTGLSSVTFPEGLTSIGYGAFYGCNMLTEVIVKSPACSIYNDYSTLGDSAKTTIYGYAGSTAQQYAQQYGYRFAFLDDVVPLLTGECGAEGDNLIWTLDIKTGLLTITGSGAMAYFSYHAPWCPYRDAITKVSLPDGLTDIGNYAFSGCTKLTSVTLPEGLTSLGYGAFRNCTGLTEITLPAPLNYIGDSAFRNCTGLTEITLPASLKSLGAYAFTGCSTLRKMVFLGNQAYVKTLWQGRNWDGMEATPEDLTWSEDGQNMLGPHDQVMIYGPATGIDGDKHTDAVEYWVDAFGSNSQAADDMYPRYYAERFGYSYFPTDAFGDVKPTAYYAVPVAWAVANGITSGTGDGGFSPKKTCTREQVVTFLWKAAGSPEPKATTSPFPDVKPGKYYFKPVLWAVEKGITSGQSDGSFGVGKACTREQVVSFLWKAVGSPEPEGAENPFTDVKPGKYYYKPVLWAVENGVTSGASATSFGVGKTCTRAQIVTFLYNVYGK